MYAFPGRCTTYSTTCLRPSASPTCSFLAETSSSLRLLLAGRISSTQVIFTRLYLIVIFVRLALGRLDIFNPGNFHPLVTIWLATFPPIFVRLHSFPWGGCQMYFSLLRKSYLSCWSTNLNLVVEYSGTWRCFGANTCKFHRSDILPGAEEALS